MSKKIITSTERKQSWQKLFGKHLSELGLPDNLYYLHIFVVSCLGDKEIRDAVWEELEGIEKFGLSREDIFKRINTQYVKESWLAHYLNRQIKEIDAKYKGEQKGSELMTKALVNVIKSINTDLPVINHYVYIVLVAIIKNTDLIRVEAPNEYVVAGHARTELPKRMPTGAEDISDESY